MYKIMFKTDYASAWIDASDRYDTEAQAEIKAQEITRIACVTMVRVVETLN